MANFRSNDSGETFGATDLNGVIYPNMVIVSVDKDVPRPLSRDTPMPVELVHGQRLLEQILFQMKRTNAYLEAIYGERIEDADIPREAAV